MILKIFHIVPAMEGRLPIPNLKIGIYTHQKYDSYSWRISVSEAFPVLKSEGAEPAPKKMQLNGAIMPNHPSSMRPSA